MPAPGISVEQGDPGRGHHLQGAAKAEDLLRLHDELDELVAGTGLGRGLLAAATTAFLLFVVFRLLQVGVGVGVGFELGIILFVSVGALVMERVWDQRRVHRLRARIAALESSADEGAPADGDQETGT